MTKNQENKEKKIVKKTSHSKVKKFDSKGEIDRVITDNEKCAARFNELIGMFELKVIGSTSTALYTPGLGKKEGFTFSDYCADVRNLKSWIRQKVNNI